VALCALVETVEKKYKHRYEINAMYRRDRVKLQHLKGIDREGLWQVSSLVVDTVVA